MKKLVICALAVVAADLLGWLPATQRDVGDLMPVQTLVASREGETLILNGGEDLEGRGATWADAMDDLRATAPGEAFFGATGQIVLMDGAQTALPELLEDGTLRPAARVYTGDGEIEPEGAAKFLAAREGGITVQQLQAAVLTGREIVLPALRSEKGRYRLDEG